LKLWGGGKTTGKGGRERRNVAERKGFNYVVIRGKSRKGIHFAEGRREKKRRTIAQKGKISPRGKNHALQKRSRKVLTTIEGIKKEIPRERENNSINERENTY